jgi:hypothetical protein
MRTYLLTTTAAVALLAAMPAHAQDATWSSSPTVAGPIGGTFDYASAANWNPATVPTGTATFGTTNGPNLSFSPTHTEQFVVGGWTFNPGASSYTFTLASTIIPRVGQGLLFDGAGIVINGGSATINLIGSSSPTTSFTPQLLFSSNATAGGATINSTFGSIIFFQNSNAGNATITTNRSITFANIASAANATITLNDRGAVVFENNSTASSATINLISLLLR